MCNISIFFCNTDIKHLQHISEISKTLETYICNMRFQRNISLLFGNGGSSAHGVHRCRARRWAELTTPVEKDAASPVEKATIGPHVLEWRGVREARWRGRKTSRYALARWRCRLAERRGGELVKREVRWRVRTEAAQAHDEAWLPRRRFLRWVFLTVRGECEWMSTWGWSIGLHAWLVARRSDKLPFLSPSHRSPCHYTCSKRYSEHKKV
jgi:hypothetical protein